MKIIIIAMVIFGLWGVFSVATAQAQEQWNLDTGTKTSGFDSFIIKNDWTLASSTVFGSGDALVAPDTSVPRYFSMFFDDDIPDGGYFEYTYRYTGTYPSFSAQHFTSLTTYRGTTPQVGYNSVIFSYPQNTFNICGYDTSPCNPAVFGTHVENTDYDIAVSFELVGNTGDAYDYFFTQTVNGTSYATTTTINIPSGQKLAVGFRSQNTNTAVTDHEVNYIFISNEAPPPPPPLTDTRIIGNFSPAVGFFDPATTTAVTLEFDYISNIPVPDTVGIQLQNISIGFQYIPQYEDIFASGIFTFSTTTPTLSMGVYQWRAVLRGDGFDYYSPWRLFSIGTSPDQSFIPLPDDGEFGCEDGNWLENTLCSFLAWAFIPPVTTMNGVLEIWQGLRDVKPFGYVIQVIELRGSMQLSDPAYTLGTLPLQTAIFDPLRAGIAVILWVLFLFYLYNRFKSMDI